MNIAKWLSIIFIVLIYSCRKAPEQPKKDNSIVEDKIIFRGSHIFLRDSMSDSILFNSSIKYNDDSLIVFLSEDNKNFINADDYIFVNTSVTTPYILLRYMEIFVLPDVDIEQVMFTKYFAFKWNSKETDSLKIVKDTDNEIRFYTNGSYLKTIPAQNRDIQDITFYR